VFTVRSRDERLEGSSFPVGSIAAQLPSPTTDRIPLSVASERTGWTADRVLYRGRTVVLKVRVSPDLIAGDVDEGYGKVADVFRRNMTIGQEVGPPKVISLSRNYSRATESSSQSRRVRSSCATSHRFGRLRIVSSLGSHEPSRPQGSAYLRLGEKVSTTRSPGASPLISGTSAESCVSRLMTTKPWSSGCRAMTGISVGV
jgi:hypothetical protein